MRSYSEATKADVRRRMSPPNRQSVARISEEMGIHVATLYLWRKGWRLEREMVTASHKDPKAGVLPTSSRWYWRPLPSTPLSSAPTAANGACTQSK
jgi:transposase-like protein